MASNKRFRFGPTALSSTLTTNILNPGTVTGGTASYSGDSLYIVLTHIAIVNKTTNSATFSLYLGATGANTAGTEVVGTATSVAGGTTFHFYGNLRLDVADFLVGGSGTATALTIQGEGEIGIK